VLLSNNNDHLVGAAAVMHVPRLASVRTKSTFTKTCILQQSFVGVDFENDLWTDFDRCTVRFNDAVGIVDDEVSVCTATCGLFGVA
jgi:hypothetical protein